MELTLELCIHWQSRLPSTKAYRDQSCHGRAEECMEIFSFDPNQYSDEYATKGFTHIPSGVTPSFIEYAQAFARNALAKGSQGSLREWAFKGKKIQFLFEFPETISIESDLKQPVASLSDLERDSITLCERHVKVYDGQAAANPPPHKDRLASEVTVGIPLQVPEDSYIILYPEQQREINAFASTALHRASLREDELPEKVLAEVEPERIQVWPGDVIFFKGSSIYHERVNPANTALLYLKLNSMNLDPLAEDPRTDMRREASLQALTASNDHQLLDVRVRLSPRLVHISRQYSRLYWKEIPHFTLWNEQEVAIGDYEFNLLKSLGHEELRVVDLLRRTGIDGPAVLSQVPALRRLVQLGAMDLIFQQ